MLKEQTLGVFEYKGIVNDEVLCDIELIKRETDTWGIWVQGDCEWWSALWYEID